MRFAVLAERDFLHSLCIYESAAFTKNGIFNDFSIKCTKKFLLLCKIATILFLTDYELNGIVKLQRKLLRAF